MDKEIFAIWNELNERLINFIIQKVKDKDVAKDINQDVFIIVFSKLDTLRNRDKIIPWIYRITRNEINAYFRKQAVHQDVEVVDKSYFLEENLTSEFSRCIQPMIHALPLKYKEALRLTEIEGVSQKELARIANISYSGAKSRVQRGREMLKSLLQQCCTVSADKYGNITDYKQNNCHNLCS